jgi:outer membrane receptor protein involved in Fe transport
MSLLRHKYTLLTVFGSALGLGIGSHVFAGSEDANQTVALSEIIVTAQKRSENIDRVAMSIQAISGEALQQSGIESPSDLAHVTPGLSFARSSANTPIYTLRGVGFNTPNLSSTSPSRGLRRRSGVRLSLYEQWAVVRCRTR